MNTGDRDAPVIAKTAMLSMVMTSYGLGSIKTIDPLAPVSQSNAQRNRSADSETSAGAVPVALLAGRSISMMMLVLSQIG